jgi:hypothetical protein
MFGLYRGDDDWTQALEQEFYYCSPFKENGILDN